MKTSALRVSTCNLSKRLYLRRCLQWSAAVAALGIAPLSPAQDTRAAPQGRRAQPRLVSIGGGLTEIIYALHAEQCLVGVDSTSLFPRAATQLPNVGYARALSAEGILALAPQVVVTTDDAGPPAVLQQLQAAGIELKILDAENSFAGLLQRVRSLGALLQFETAAQQLLRSLEQRWQNTQNTVQKFIALRSQRPLRTVFLMLHVPGRATAGGRETAADVMLRYAGAHNALTQFSGYKPLSAEAMVAAEPDAIVVTMIDSAASQQQLQTLIKTQQAAAMALPGVAQTPAGRNGRILVQEIMFSLGFGPRLPEAVLALHRGLYAV